MKRVILALAISIMSTVVYAATEPEIIWAGGEWRLANESAPGYIAETFVYLGQLDSMYIFSDPMVILKETRFATDLGVGVRLPIPGSQVIAGYNLFLDMTTDNVQKRMGTGAEIFHPKFSAHLNIYLPTCTQHHGEEAIPGIDLTLGIPIPDAGFITVWPGIYYYGGEIQTDVGGVSLAVEVKPVKAVSIIVGGRSDALEVGRNDPEIFTKLQVTIPMRHLGKDLFKFDKGEYPINIKNQLDHRIIREPFITVEHKEL